MTLGDNNIVSIGEKYYGQCCVKRCKRRIVHKIFADDGQPKLSRYIGTYCYKHLHEGIQLGHEINKQKGLKNRK